MEVTRQNFEAAFAQILRLLPAAAAVGLDMECTGIKPDLWVCRADTPAEYYYKMFPVPTRYRMIQLGLSLFVPAQGGYTAHTFFFYLMPDSQEERMEQVFRLSVGTIEFLNRAGNIDYNKWLKQGLSYYNAEQRENLAAVLERSNVATQLAAMSLHPQPACIIDPAELQRITARLAAFKHWVAFRSGEPFVFSEKKPYLRRYFHENNAAFQQHHAELSVLERRNDEGTLVVEFRRRTGPKLATAAVDAAGRLDAALGFSRLWDQLTAVVRARKIPVVGHNFAIDLLFVAAGLERSLPRRYSAGKALLAELFPRVYDTKAMAEALGLETLSLSELHAEVVGRRREKKTPAFTHAHGDGHGYHNAGVDAQATGEVFLTLLTLLPTPDRFANIVKIFSNRFYHMDLGAQDRDALTQKTAIVLYPKGPAATREKLLHEINKHKKETQENNYLIEHRGLPCGPRPRVYFLQGMEKRPISEALKQRLGANFLIKSLDEHYNEVYTFLEELNYS